MKTLHIIISTILLTIAIFGISSVYAQYGEGFSPPQHYPPTNDTKLKLIVMNSTEFKERTLGYNYTFAGINYDWISKGNNYFDFGGAEVTFFVFGRDNGTTKGDVFSLDSQMKVKSVFEYDADHPPAGYYTTTCYGGCGFLVPRCQGCILPAVNETVEPTGPRIDVLVSKPSYTSNETIQIMGFYNPNTIIHVDLVDPNDKIKNSTLLQSDNLGNFQKKFVVPSDAINGTWKINATSGTVHSTRYITVISSNYQDNQINPNNSGPTITSQNSMTPLQQLRSGTDPYFVTCKQGLELAIKIKNNSPACVKSTNLERLLKQGWINAYDNNGKYLPKNMRSYNPLGVTALVTYHAIDSCLGMSCPPYTFYLKINSNSTAYLLGYDICGNDLCVKNNTLSILLPKNNIQIANYTSIGLSDNKKWNYGDTADIRLEISSSKDGKDTYFLDIKNSTIVP